MLVGPSLLADIISETPFSTIVSRCEFPRFLGRSMFSPLPARKVSLVDSKQGGQFLPGQTELPSVSLQLIATDCSSSSAQGS